MKTLLLPSLIWKRIKLVFAILSFLFSIGGFVIPFFLVNRANQNWMVPLSYLFLFGFGFLGIALVSSFVLDRERERYLQREIPNEQNVNGKIISLEPWTYRQKEPMTKITLAGGTVVFWCRLFGEFEGKVGDSYRFAVSSSNRVIRWEKQQ